MNLNVQFTGQGSKIDNFIKDYKLNDINAFLNLFKSFCIKNDISQQEFDLYKKELNTFLNINPVFIYTMSWSRQFIMNITKNRIIFIFQ